MGAGRVAANRRTRKAGLCHAPAEALPSGRAGLLRPRLSRSGGQCGAENFADLRASRPPPGGAGKICVALALAGEAPE